MDQEFVSLKKEMDEGGNPILGGVPVINHLDFAKNSGRNTDYVIKRARTLLEGRDKSFIASKGKIHEILRATRDGGDIYWFDMAAVNYITKGWKGSQAYREFLGVDLSPVDIANYKAGIGEKIKSLRDRVSVLEKDNKLLEERLAKVEVSVVAKIAPAVPMFRDANGH